MKDTPTPRTDAVILLRDDTSHGPEYVYADFCRQLERELAESKAQIEVWRNEVELLREELAKADSALQSNIDTFLDLKQQRDRLAEALRSIIINEESYYRGDAGTASIAREALAAVEGGDDE